MASLSPRTAPIPFVQPPRNSTILSAHTLATSLASQKFRRKSATGCAATLLCEQQHQPGARWRLHAQSALLRMLYVISICLRIVLQLDWAC
eukprot:COSAG02_NODE_79_length_40228_cov_18.435762_5_plen_91_part_00